MAVNIEHKPGPRESVTLPALDRLKDEVGGTENQNELNRLYLALQEVIAPEALPQWFRTPHPGLGGKTPLDAVRQGQSKLLWDMILAIENGIAS